MKWVDELREWLFDPQNSDQEKKGKIKFLQKPASGPPTKLTAVGISNGRIKKKAADFYRNNTDMIFQNLINGIDEIWLDFGISEAHVLACNILARYKKKFNSDLWKLIDLKWINKLDHWISSDHLGIDVYPHFQIKNPPYVNDIKNWIKSENPWRRRIATICLLKHVRTSREDTLLLMDQIDVIKSDKNYYVRKTIHWMLREASKANPQGIEKFIRINIKYFYISELNEAIKRLKDPVKTEIINLFENKSEQ